MKEPLIILALFVFTMATTQSCRSVKPIGKGDVSSETVKTIRPYKGTYILLEDGSFYKVGENETWTNK